MAIFLTVCQEPYLEPNQKSMVELFCQNSERLFAVNFFRKNSHHKCLTVFQKRLGCACKE